MTQRFGFLVALMLAVGCTTPATQVIVTVQAEPGVRADAARLHLVVLGGVGRTEAPTASRFDRLLAPGTTDPAYPFTVALSPLDGDVGRSYSVTATAETGGRGFVGQVRIIGGYVEGETQRVTITLEDVCRSVTCGVEQTCRAGACVDAHVDTVLPPADAGQRDGGGDGGSRDAGRADGGADGGADAGTPDAGPPTFTPRNLTSDVWGSATGGVSVVTGATIDTTSGAVLVDGIASRAFAVLDIPAAGDCQGILALVTHEFHVAAGATVSVTGTRGLAIISTGAIVVDGLIDVGAHGETAGPGGVVRPGGGGYGTLGGAQGCDSGSGVIPTFGDTGLTGLCGGSASDRGGGGGGGAVQLASLTSIEISATGVVRAVGGGATALSGHGGSGGGVLFQAPTVTIAGTVSVNGGGGAAGGDRGASPLGADGAVNAVAAAGGPYGSYSCGCTGSASWGNGGAGAWQGGAAHNGGGGSLYGCCSYDTACYYGGGGGGGAGRIRVEAGVRDYRTGRVLEYTGLTGAFTDGPLN